MKVEREKQPFEPVFIIIENDQELEDFYHMLNEYKVGCLGGTKERYDNYYKKYEKIYMER